MFQPNGYHPDEHLDDHSDNNSILWLPVILAASIAIPLMAGYLFATALVKAKQKHTVAPDPQQPSTQSSPTPTLTAPMMLAEETIPVTAFESDRDSVGQTAAPQPAPFKPAATPFCAVHDPQLDFSPVEMLIKNKSQRVRCYNLDKNGLDRVVAVILSEVAAGAHESGPWSESQPGETAQLEGELIQFNVEQYEPGHWMHLERITYEHAADTMKHDILTAVAAFTQKTGFPIGVLRPYLTTCQNKGHGVVEFELGLDLTTTDLFGKEPAFNFDNRVQLPQGSWLFAPEVGPGYKGADAQSHIEACQGLMKAAIESLTAFTLTTGDTVEGLLVFPVITDDADGLTISYHPDGVDVLFGDSLEEAAVEPALVQSTAVVPMEIIPAAEAAAVFPKPLPVMRPLDSPPIVAVEASSVGV
ncbi:MAG: hypothetical protein BroJett011_46550 [Chloroflexota bacterium]|nr:MAG: hypothetical protein BroJett011_46550 [Chloroflexota bacterium]